MELVEYAQAVDHSRMPLLLRVLNALGWYAFLADIPLMAYAYCLVMARNGFPNLTMDEGRLVGASVLLPFVAFALMSPAENWNPPRPEAEDHGRVCGRRVESRWSRDRRTRIYGPVVRFPPNQRILPGFMETERAARRRHAGHRRGKRRTAR